MEARAAKKCSVPRADEPRRSRTAASNVVALVSYFATDRLLRTNNLAINLYTLLTSIIYRSSRGNRPDSPVDSPPRPEYRTAEEHQPPMPQHHEEKMEPCTFQPDTRSTYKRKRNSVLGWPLERRDRFARNSAHPRSSERPPASRVSIHSWLPSRRQRGETFLVDASTSTRRARENEEEQRIGESGRPRSSGASVRAVCPIIERSRKRGSKQRRDWRTAVRGEMSNTKTQNSRFRVLGRSRGKVSRTTRGRRERGKPGGGSRSLKGGKGSWTERFLFIRSLPHMLWICTVLLCSG